MEFTVATHNSFVGVALFKPIASIICRQEMYYLKSRARLRRSQPNYAHWMPGERKRFSAASNPISWDKRVWKLVSGGHLQGTFRSRRGVNPLRWITWVVLEHLETGQLVVVICVHMPNRGRRPWMRWLAKNWNDNKTVLDGLVDGFQTSHPQIPIVVCGDVNRRRWIQVPGLLTPQPSGPIDQFLHTPWLHMLDLKAGPFLRSDHRARIATFRIGN